ncbi:hypothetical protein ACNSOL_12050 (plasmid) [Aliarcobacter lanthieri]|uniref:hypothetical protein n=1 Tax=Aliarcobacter lanthieri TaxID=1355374 RepID=UPI003AAB21BF
MKILILIICVLGSLFAENNYVLLDDSKQKEFLLIKAEMEKEAIGNDMSKIIESCINFSSNEDKALIKCKNQNIPRKRAN